MRSQSSMKRGDLWTASGGGGYAGKPRPVLIVQDDRFDTPDSVIVVPLTTVARDAPLLRIAVGVSDSTGLKAESYLMIDKLTTVPRAKLGHRVGTIGDESMSAANKALLVFLGMA